jgi:Zn-dependent protease
LITATDALFTLLPVMRWMRLWLVDARRPARRLDAAARRGSKSLDPLILTTYALSTCVLVFGAFLLPAWWEEGTRHLRAEVPAALQGWIPLLALVPIALLRLLWLVELRRYYQSGDLA